MIKSEIRFSTPQGTLPRQPIQFGLILSTELMSVAGRSRLVAQPGGLTFGFVLHLVQTASAAHCECVRMR